MQIGSLGSVVFAVSEVYVKTISDYSRKSSARIATHEIIGKKPLSEFLGPAADSITFSIKLSAFRGVSPKSEAEQLRRMCLNGEAVTFVMAGSPVTHNKWLIENVDEDGNYYDGMGNLISADVKLTLREYAEVVQIGSN